ncbi:MAG TPA: hypothetical protein VNO83_18275 [Pseudonocardia sp.]|nr:hypothetical protein [Pseudonocardia sp.]
MWAAFRELDRVVKRYATATLTLLFVVIGPATADQPAPAGPPAAGSPAGVDRLDGRQGADGEDPERAAPRPDR